MRNRLTIFIAILWGLFSFAANAEDRVGSRIEYAKFPVKMLAGVSERDYAIYLPPNYDADTTRTYPVLYLLHGGFGSYVDWPESGKLKATADSLITSGRIQPMVIVCPDGRYRDNTMWLDIEEDGWTPEEHFFEELMPYMESKYRISSEKKGKAIAGLSLGGAASLQYAIDHPDKFAASCLMSAYTESVAEVFTPGLEWVEKAVATHNQIERIRNGSQEEIDGWNRVEWLVDCGDNDFTLPSNIKLEQAMNDRRLRHEFMMRRGAHDWDYWSSSLPPVLDFVNRAF